MNRYGFHLVVDDEKLDEIFKRMAKAKQEIEECYAELRALDVIKFTSEENSPCTEAQGEETT